MAVVVRVCAACKKVFRLPSPSSSSSSSADGEPLAELHRSAEQRGKRRCGSTLRALRKKETREQRPIGLSEAAPPETFTHELSVNSFTLGGSKKGRGRRSWRARWFFCLQLSTTEPLAGKVYDAQQTTEVEILSAHVWEDERTDTHRQTHRHCQSEVWTHLPMHFFSFNYLHCR